LGKISQCGLFLEARAFFGGNMICLRSFMLSFEEDILAFLGLATVLATFSKIWAIFFQTSGHPACTIKT
jgi:hypothetical protein